MHICSFRVLTVLILFGFSSHALPAIHAMDSQPCLESQASDCSTNLIRQVKPDYPKQAKREKLTGEVQVKAVISKDGKLRDISPLSGHPLLVEAAVQALSRWRYQQCLVNGESVETPTRIRITFKLDAYGSPQISANYMDDETPSTPTERASSPESSSEDEEGAPVYGPNEPGMKPPQLIAGADPNYPMAARKDGIQGTVELTCTITATGAVREAIVVKSLNPMLDNEAVEAVKRWRFKPATKDGNPVSVKVRIPVAFRLY